MRKLLTMFLFGSMVFALALPTALAQAPANEHNCPASMAIPATVGTGNPPFSPNQNLCLPLLAPVGGSMGPLAFIVQGVEPGDRVDSQGTIYVVSIRGVPGGIDLWRWYQTTDGAPNGDIQHSQPGRKQPGSGARRHSHTFDHARRHLHRA